MKIIGISGKAGSGKDTIANFIKEFRGDKPTVIVHFADAIKQRAKELGWNGEKDANGRVLLQYIGLQERQKDELYWVKIAFKSMKQQDTPETLFVIPDVRFTNEAECIHWFGGLIWKVKRPSEGLQGVAAKHQSEIEMDSYYAVDVLVGNTSTIEDLKEAVQNAMQDTIDLVSLWWPARLLKEL